METENQENLETQEGSSLGEIRAARYLVTPSSLTYCFATWGELKARILDISFLRVVVEEVGEWPAIAEDQSIPMMFSMNGYDFAAEVRVHGRGEGWIRFQFHKLVPSCKSMLRLFLCPKKVGESLMEDKKMTDIRHYHGLNESELLFDKDGNVLFTYLDYLDSKFQFLVQIRLDDSTIKVGRLTRSQYMTMGSFVGDLGLIPLSDKENYTRMSECRDIVTNFRPSGQLDYNLKQKMQKLISENLYSTGHRVDFPMVRAIRLPYLSTEH